MAEGRRSAGIGVPLRLTDKELCQKGAASIITGLQEEGVYVIPGLFKCARGVLGEYPRDLRWLPEAELRKILKEELVPKLAGRVGGAPTHPWFFRDCATVLKAMIALGEDTRAFRADETAGFLHEEARFIRGNSRAER